MNLQALTPAQLLEKHRDTLLKLGFLRVGADPDTTDEQKTLARTADQLEEEILRRMAW